MPSFIRLLTETPTNINTPPSGYTSLYASSGTSNENQYQLYIKDPYGNSYQVGGFASGGTFSAMTTFNSGATFYNGVYLGQPASEGTWRISADTTNNNLVFQLFTGGTYVTKNTISGVS